MGTEQLISIIVPVYNVEKYLKKCVESILLQTHKNLQVILVDDGSTDNSGYICDDYAQKDKRIMVIHKKNGGLSSARNAGIDKAQGAFISCIDSDDFVDPDFISSLYQHLVNADADMAVGNFYYYYENNFYKKHHGNQNIMKVCNREESIDLIGRGKVFTGSAWGKLYKKELFSNIRYPEGKLCEDQFVIYKLILLCKTIVFDSTAMYGYTVRHGSIMNASATEKLFDVIEAAKENNVIILKEFPQLEYICVLRQVEAYFEILNRLKLNDFKKKMFSKIAYEALGYIRYYLKDIIVDYNHIYTKRQKVYCALFSISPNVFIGLHSALISLKKRNLINDSGKTYCSYRI